MAKRHTPKDVEAPFAWKRIPSKLRFGARVQMASMVLAADEAESAAERVAEVFGAPLKVDDTSDYLKPRNRAERRMDGRRTRVKGRPSRAPKTPRALAERWESVD